MSDRARGRNEPVPGAESDVEAARVPGVPPVAEGLLQLQATGGNQMVARLLGAQRAVAPPGDDDVADRIRSRLGGGQALPDPVRDQAEAGLGRRLGDVRVHDDAAADALSNDLDATAFTTGDDIFFSAGAYQPDTSEGYSLLAHELTHTLQQGAGPVAGRQVTPDLRVSDPHDRDERAASATAARLTAQRETGDLPNASGTRPAGALAVQRAVAAGTVQREPAPAPGGDREAAQRTIDEVRNALGILGAADFLPWDRKDGPIAALLRYHGDRSLIRAGLAGDLGRYLSGQDLVRATALLHDDNLNGVPTRIALALHGRGTRDISLFTLLEAVPVAERGNVRRRYDEMFSRVGAGSLLADLESDLSEEDCQKATALLHRDLTQADHLYLDNVNGHAEAVRQRIQKIWGDGATGLYRMAGLEADWKRFVNNEERWTTKTWTTMSMRDAMDDEMWGQDLQLVFAVLDQYRDLGGSHAGSVAQGAQEQARLAAANATLTAATSGGFLGLGTKEDDVFWAVTEIRTVWEERLAGVANTPDEAPTRAQWERERTRLLAFLPGEMDDEGTEFEQARLMLAGSLTVADEFYLAWKKLGSDNDDVVDFLIRTWAAGKMNELRTIAEKDRLDETGKVIRPRFELWRTVSVSGGLPYRRAAALTANASDGVRGAEWMKVELDNADDLKRVYGVLQNVDPALRSATITTFADTYLGSFEGADATQKFLSYINRRYEDSATRIDFQNLIDPPKTAEEKLKRSQAQWDAMHTGLGNWLLNTVSGAYDELTGEQREQVAGESLDSLRQIVKHQGAKDTELDAMAAMLGKSKNELVDFEYGVLQTSLRELRDLRAAVAETLASAVEVVVEAAVSIATAGSASGPLLASLASAFSGMAMREGLLGADYDFASSENAQKMILIVAGKGVGILGASLTEGIGAAAKLAGRPELRRTVFIREGLQDVFKAINKTVMANAFDQKLPSAEDIGKYLAELGRSGAVSGAGELIGAAAGPGELASRIERVRRNVGVAITNQLISGLSGEAAAMVESGFGNIGAQDLIARFAHTAVMSIQSGVSGGIVTTLVQDAKKKQEEANPVAP